MGYSSPHHGLYYNSTFHTYSFNLAITEEYWVILEKGETWQNSHAMQQYCKFSNYTDGFQSGSKFNNYKWYFFIKQLECY